MKARPVFIHALFRTGSTYIWNKFRQLPGHVCYYEPFHQLLVGVTRDNVQDALTRNFKAAGHPELDRHYLYEYEALLQPETPGVPFFMKELSFDWFCQANGEAHPGQKKYVDFLIRACGSRVPLFQFNRTALRSAWFQSAYPRSFNIYLYRDPRDQWQSYAALQSRTGFDVFFIMDVMALSKNRDNPRIRPLQEALPLLAYHAADHAEEESFYRVLSQAYGEKEKYFIFYYLWLLALIENAAHADALWDINALADDPAYRAKVQRWLEARKAGSLDFSDCHITRYSCFPLPAAAMQEIEARVQGLIAGIRALAPSRETLRRLPAGIAKRLRAAGPGRATGAGKIREEGRENDWLRLAERMTHSLQAVIKRLREDLKKKEQLLGAAQAALKERSALATRLQNNVAILRNSYSFRLGRFMLLPMRLGKKVWQDLKARQAEQRLPENEMASLAAMPPAKERKIALADQLRLDFGLHRSGLKYGLRFLLGLHHPRGVALDAFIERTFSWLPQGNQAHETPWIGFIHVPPRSPEWFHPEQGNAAIFASESWQRSLPFCRGLFAFSRYHQKYLAERVPVPVETLRLPSETPDLKWSPEAFAANADRKVVQVGWWLRRLHAIYQLPKTDFQKAFLDVGHPSLPVLMAKEKEILIRTGDFDSVDLSSVVTIPCLSNPEYDRLLSRNVVFMFLYDSSACNAIVECMVRHTPLLVNPLAAVVEYLGDDYPFYFETLPEAAAKLMDRDLILRTHDYLRRLPRVGELSGESFYHAFVDSAIHRSLAVPPEN